MMADRFYYELGRLQGTDADPDFWARHFGLGSIAAGDILRQLISEGRAIERNGMIYRT